MDGGAAGIAMLPPRWPPDRDPRRRRIGLWPEAAARL